MTTIKIAGQEYPLALTLGAMEQLDEMCGGIENAAKVFDGKKMGQIVETLVKMLGILIRGGCDYMAAEGQDAPKPQMKTPSRPAFFPGISRRQRPLSSRPWRTAWAGPWMWSRTKKTGAPRRTPEPCVVLVLRLPDRAEQAGGQGHLNGTAPGPDRLPPDQIRGRKAKRLLA